MRRTDTIGRRPRLALFALGIALGLAGCADMSTRVGGSSAFVDPARYALYDCRQLATAYDKAAARELELSALMAKAERGTAGGLMAELGYRPDFLTARANREQIEAEMAEKKCTRNAAPIPSIDSADKPVN